ncbi:DUF4190 domain-containing protein [Haloactinomyces albus]|uniref:DUF4190 domain-containing protein n=1 Tax=Haloactinomyces albus TaxID=1352928 RepID=A0AAE3Z949_9ACTN|nr:DUF4190 domain-containing protein [Haloactinomyces albus]MDR7300617.1 hypothetical protein [Haloactinomyces albus]
MSIPPPPPPGQAVQPRNGLGTAGFVLGLLAALFSLMPIIGMIAWPLSILGLIFGILGILRARKGAATNKGLSIAGTVLAAIGLVTCILWTALTGAAINSAANEAESELNRIEQEINQSIPPTQVDKQATNAPTKLAFGEKHEWPGGEAVVISAPTKYTETNPLILGENERGAAVDITITNNTGDEINPISWDITATHGGRPAETILGDDTFADAAIPAGGELTITRAFKVGTESAELQVSVAPNVFAENTVYYHGTF